MIVYAWTHARARTHKHLQIHTQLIYGGFFCLLFLGINCWNPAFDVTPASLITGGIVTEFGVFKPSELAEKLVPIVMSLYLEDPDHVNTGPDPS